MRRLLAILLVALVLAPGTWVRTSVAHSPLPRAISWTPLAIGTGAFQGAELVRGWQLSSTHPEFGGFSALAWRGDGSLFALSDRGALFVLSLPGPDQTRLRGRRLPPIPGPEGLTVDAESLAIDRQGQKRWVAYESANAIARFNVMLERESVAYPRMMQDWDLNSGAEAMVRLSDGRFLVMAEGNVLDDEPSDVLLFAGDPVEGAPAQSFTFQPPAGFRPVDMAQLPDGRVLVLLRAVYAALPPRFSTAVMLLDPQAIRPGRAWPGQVIARLAHESLADNYEGLAVAPGPDGAVDLWLVSDDNHSVFQRSLLLHLRWHPARARVTDKRKGAEAVPPRPSR